jgi:hypothetical protein
MYRVAEILRSWHCSVQRLFPVSRFFFLLLWDEAHPALKSMITGLQR